MLVIIHFIYKVNAIQNQIIRNYIDFFLKEIKPEEELPKPTL